MVCGDATGGTCDCSRLVYESDGEATRSIRDCERDCDECDVKAETEEDREESAIGE